MAGRRRTINRKEQRTDYEEEAPEKAEEEEAEDEEEEGEDEEEGEEEEAEAEAEEEGGEEEEAAGDEDDEDAPKAKKKKPKPKKAPAPKRARSTKKVVRQKAVWVIYDNSSKQIETFPFNQRAAAEKLLAEKAEDPKKGYYLQMVKVPLEEK
jgi:cobalamin biosynthesis protein CobT